MRFCKKCVYPEISINLMLDDEGVCSACRVAEEVNKIDNKEWERRQNIFYDIIKKGRSQSPSGYDCIIPVSGGKDSYWQTHIIKEVFGLNPLLVTYHGNNYLEEGQKNLDRMRHVFNVDHFVFGPGIETIVKLNRICFKKMGDMNWHNHAGIYTVPMIVAVNFRIPIVIWGETTWDLSGMFSPDDFVEYNKRLVLEHDLRGFTWKEMVGEEGLTEKDLLWLHMPSDEEFADVGIRGLFVGNFFKWEPNKHSKLMIEKYQWEPARLPFERTYRRFSNLDDMHENGIHDYMKYIKFGYGRASDHVSKDIRTGDLTREKGIELVRKYDHVKPRRDLERWLKYVDMEEKEFDEIADSFRDPRVWWKDSQDNWKKQNIWDEK